MAFCPHCGKRLSDGAAFCGACGTKVNHTNDQMKTSSSPQVSAQKTAPTFTPPTAPTFTPPAAPTFTPPAPTFTPPTRSSNGAVCYYHPDEPAVAKCAICGKYICQDCFDSYGVTSGKYAGQALCYDCTQRLVEENVETLTRNKSKIKTQFILSLVGIGLGLIIGIIVGAQSGFGPALLTGFIFAAIGGVFLSFMKTYLAVCWELIKSMFSSIFDGSGIWGAIISIIVAIFQIGIEVIKCIYLTISNTIYYITYLKRTSGFIESDQAALREMQDYMEYTIVRNKNRGVDIETLLQQNSELADNSVAQLARTQTEEQIEARMRNCVATINENGEIIRSFRDNAKVAA